VVSLVVEMFQLRESTSPGKISLRTRLLGDANPDGQDQHHSQDDARRLR
jgi:hypothetical protein